MNKWLKKLICCLCVLCLLPACIQVDTSEGPFTTKNTNDTFSNATPVKIDADMLQRCYDYTEALGYKIKDKDKYKSVIIGESHVETVHIDGDNNRDLLDEKDYLILFDEIRIIMDADTSIILGNIPYA